MTVQLSTKTTWTAQAYLEWARPDDATLYEVVNGQLKAMPSPIPFHQTIIMNIAFAIKLWLRVQQIGRVYISPVDVVLGDALVIPDLFFVSSERLDIQMKMYIRTCWQDLR